MTITSAAILIFLVMDPLGNVPLFLSTLRNIDPARHRRIIARELLIALAVMLVFLLGGQFLLRLLHVTPAALTAAGGSVLFLIAIRMIFPEPASLDEVNSAYEPFVAPLVIPYTARPSVLATELLLISRDPDLWQAWMAAICLSWLASAVILYLASHLCKILGERELIAIERLMGMLLVIVAVEMMMTGIAQFFANATTR